MKTKTNELTAALTQWTKEELISVVLEVRGRIRFYGDPYDEGKASCYYPTHWLEFACRGGRIRIEIRADRFAAEHQSAFHDGLGEFKTVEPLLEALKPYHYTPKRKEKSHEETQPEKVTETSR